MKTMTDLNNLSFSSNILQKYFKFVIGRKLAVRLGMSIQHIVAKKKKKPSSKIFPVCLIYYCPHLPMHATC